MSSFAASCFSDSKVFVFAKVSGERFEAFFSSVQQAINEAENGSTIYVPVGIFYENVVVNKTVSLVGASGFSSIIDGSNNGTVVEVTANGVVVRGFKLQNSGYGWTRHGIYAYMADYCTIEDNHLFKDCHNIRLNYSRSSTVRGNTIDGVMTQPTMYGIRVENSVNCTVEGNHVSDCVGAIHLQNATECVVARNLLDWNSQGIRFYTPCTYNEVFENNICNNSYDGMIDAMPDNATLAGNRVFHNNFINNSSPFIYTITGVTWDDEYPSGGNYWSRYNGTDLKSGRFQNETGYDGIGDAYYGVNPTEKDSYPLTHPYGSIVNVVANKVFLTIASAVAAPETLDGHLVAVKTGVYHEHIVLNKSILLLGENKSNTIIDGDGLGTIVTVEADNVGFAGFTVRNSGSNFPPYGNDCGLLLDHSSNGNISSNVFVGNRIGVYMLFSEKNHLEDNMIHSGESGIWLWHSGSNTLRRNTMSNNTYSFGVFGNDFEAFDNDIDLSNSIEGKPIRYVVNGADRIFDDSEPTSALYLVNCANITVRNLNLSGNGQGMLCFNVTDSRIQNLTTSKNNYGIDLLHSFNNNVSDNHCEGNWVGIRLESSDNNTVKNNILVAGEKGISLYEASNNRVEGNTLENSIFGIRLSTSHSNHIYRNNFIQNTAQVDLVASYQNVWDDGVEGNFWSDHQILDLNRDGVADDEYLVDAENRDHCPLSGLYYGFAINGEAGHEVAVISNSTVRDLIFESSNHMLVLTVEGSNGTSGFCRVRVPHALIEPELNVVIDGGFVEVTYANYSLHDDGVCRWIYFEYRHSMHEVVIVAEFPLLFFWLACVSAAWLFLFLERHLKKKGLKLQLRTLHTLLSQGKSTADTCY
jgi:parallel beta-helix repeat protein